MTECRGLTSIAKTTRDQLGNVAKLTAEHLECSAPACSLVLDQEHARAEPLDDALTADSCVPPHRRNLRTPVTHLRAGPRAIAVRTTQSRPDLNTPTPTRSRIRMGDAARVVAESSWWGS